MTDGVWFVSCERRRAISLAELETRIAHLREVQVSTEPDQLVLEVRDSRSGTIASIVVGLSGDPHVAVEAAEIAERLHRPDLQALDARYELVFDLRLADEVYNTLVHVASALEEACGAVVYDANEGSLR